MGTIIRFALHSAGAPAYRAAFDVLARMGFDPLEAPPSWRTAGTYRTFPAAALGVRSEDPAELARAAFVALHDAHLRPVAVTGCRFEEGARA
jgi:hypothetical protein